MIVGIVIQNKSYPWTQYLAVLLMTLGMVLLSLGGKQLDPNFNIFGIFLLSAALFADAFMGNIQELIYNRFNPTTSEMMFFNKGLSAVITGMICLFNGQLWGGLVYIVSHPYVIFWIAISIFIIFHIFISLIIIFLIFYCFALAGTCGEYAIMVIIQLFGALVVTMTTTMRKALSIILSFIIFPKPYSHVYTVAIISLFSGTFLSVYKKYVF